METHVVEPRGGDVTLGGLPWLARMIDKARLEAAGQLEQFDLEYPCPMDRSLLSRLGVDSQIFQDVVVSATTDDEVLKALQQVGASLPQQ